MQHGFYFDHELCVKCHACEIACKSWNEVEVGPRWREVVKIESGTYTFEAVPCAVCDGRRFDRLAEKDRCGLRTPVAMKPASVSPKTERSISMSMSGVQTVSVHLDS